MSEFRYRAFISYSWSDAKWGNWLHHKLETYRTPAALAGKDGALGKVPTRLNPIFKDREEEAAGASIGDAVEKALLASEFLIVVCSPNSAQSRWVDREIAFFKAHRDPGKVLALIVDGEPGSADAECFPIALTHSVNPDLTIGDSNADAPLAADARITGDGKRRAFLKLAAAMLGVGLDELVNRDERRRAIRTRIIVATSLALATVMSGLAWVAIQSRNEAEFQRNEADGLIEFMLTDLREKLEPVGRLDALDVVGERALDYYAAQKLDNLDADALGRRARALLLVGEISNLRGESDAALQAFTEAAATTREQLTRDPGNGKRVYDHAQSVFWVGYIAHTRGEVEDAEAQFREYQRLAARLIKIDPGNPDWQMESSYAESNLGVMLNEQGRHIEAEPAFARGLQRIEVVAAGEDYDAGRQLEIGQTINWVAITKEALGKYAEALTLHRREVLIYKNVLRRDPANSQAKNRLSVAEQFVGSALLITGDSDEAVAAYDRAISLNATLRALEPDNVDWQETEVRGHLGQARQMAELGRAAQGRAHLLRASVLLEQMIAADPSNTIWSGELRSTAMHHDIAICLVEKDLKRAETVADLLLAAVSKLEKGSGPVVAHEAYRWIGDVQLRLGRPGRAQTLWSEALQRLPPGVSADSDRFRLLRRLGRTDEAAAIAKALDRRGYRHPAYLREQ